jgi:hypothetical protein
VTSPSLAPTFGVDTSGSDDDDVNTAIAVGLAVPLGILCIFCIVYFAWYQNVCGLFRKSDSLKVSLLEENGGDGGEEIAKDSSSLNV